MCLIKAPRGGYDLCHAYATRARIEATVGITYSELYGIPLYSPTASPPPPVGSSYEISYFGFKRHRTALFIIYTHIYIKIMLVIAPLQTTVESQILSSYYSVKSCPFAAATCQTLISLSVYKKSFRNARVLVSTIYATLRDHEVGFRFIICVMYRHCYVSNMVKTDHKKV